ncbi:hypothetical protein C8R44DRAFT_841988 [Mycena epipterygia]|nr:hypothetical protein C8R44DRAFT_841988 [Mycena epipterygia]
MAFCKDCTKSKMEVIAGIAYCVATLTVDYPKDKVIMFITNVFGITLPNSQLLADDFARNGFKLNDFFWTVLPGYLHGDPVPLDALSPRAGNFDLTKWFVFIAALKASIGAVGFCFSGRWGFDLAFENVIFAAATAHPSQIKIPGNLEKYAAVSKASLLLNTCMVDAQFPHEAQAKADEIFAGFEPGYRREYFEGCTHGFAIRGDLSDPKVKAGKEGVFKATVERFRKHV